MKKLFFITVTFFVIMSSIQAKSVDNISKPLESISVKLLLSGSLNGEYNFSGPMGAQIKASSDATDPICSISSLFRKVKYRGIKSLEAWLTLDCTFEGQKGTYKAHRIYLSLDKPKQTVKLPVLAKNLKNVVLEFHDISLKVSK